MTKLPTIKAVTDEADRLRTQAENLTNPASSTYDPYAKPYAPSDEAAKKVCQRIANRLERELRARIPQPEVDEVKAVRAQAPALAIAHMRMKFGERTAARTADRFAEQDRRNRMVNLQKKANSDRRRKVQDLSLGQRLDRVIAQLSMVGSAKAASMEAPVAGSDNSAPTPIFPGDPVTKAKERAYDLVTGLENDLDGARRRQVEREAA